MPNFLQKMLRSLFDRGSSRESSRGWIDTEGNVPHWVDKEVYKIRKKHGGTSSSLLGKYWTIKGHHYVYRISFGGQGGSICSILKKKR